MKQCIYKVSGMHCPSCEILIEKKVLDISGVKSADASLAKGEIFIVSEGKAPEAGELNKIFAKDNYKFLANGENEGYVIRGEDILKNIFFLALFVGGFWWLKSVGFDRFAGVNSASSLSAFFLMGLVAGASTCAALVGGIVLSMSKQWAELYGKSDSLAKRVGPIFIFTVGRLVSYAVLGAVLGALGAKLQLSLAFSSVLVLAVSAVMLVLGLDMLGVPGVGRLKPALPKFITRRIANEKNFSGRYMPAVMGALTFFLPCGFTITAQGVALISGNAFQGGLIMFLFALGTAPALMAIGTVGAAFSRRPHIAATFGKIAGIIVLLFALYNINAQMTVLGWNAGGARGISKDGLPAVVDGKQIIKMTASSRGYNPNYFKVRAGVPVRWEITDTGTSGCTNAIISKLFDGQIDLSPGKTSVKEFTPATAGKFRFSCWMGMVSGIIEVVN